MAFNPQAPVAQKVADELVFRSFQGEGVEFFNRTSLTPLRVIIVTNKLPTAELKKTEILTSRLLSKSGTSRPLFRSSSKFVGKKP